MADIATEGAYGTWTSPQCPFSIDYSTRVMDDIRLAVVDAFFSLPRGGAEIGGILLGTHEPGRIAVTGYQPIDCEHATGPSFTLSKNDETKLQAQLNAVRDQVVGWYHSHTRSEIFLSDADLNIYKRFFPEPWQVALVMKPHTFQPMRIGFFFGEADGNVHASGAYQEMLLEALPMRQVPSGEPAFRPPAAAPYRRETDTRVPAGPIIDLVMPQDEPAAAPGRPMLVKAAEPPLAAAAAASPGQLAPMQAAPVAAAPPPPAEPARVPVPPANVPLVAPAAPGVAAAFPVTQPEHPRRRRVYMLFGAALVLAAAAVFTHGLWVPRLVNLVKSPAPPIPQPALGLNTLETDGQLQIRWDRSAVPSRPNVSGTLEITDGAQAPPQSIAMDLAHLQAGVFTYGRQSEKTEVKLVIHMPDGREVREATSYLGPLPHRPPPTEDAEARRQREELARQAAKLKSELAAQAKRTKKLERSLNNVQKTIRDQQRKRMENQVPPK